MKIAFYPTIKKAENDFTIKVIDAIKLSSKENELIDFPSYYELRRHAFPQIVFFNWYENFPNSRKLFIKELIKKIHSILLLKRYRTRIYTVFHNKKPHESRFPKTNLWFYKFLLKKSDRIIVLSDSSRKYIAKLVGEKALAKVVKISHPSYKIKNIVYSCKPDKFTVLFSGFLRPYKNIELIFELARRLPDVNFIVAGRAIDELYLRKLTATSAGISNIELISGFQDDEMLEALIARSSIMILPYNKESSLNSGMLFYAFSKGINVIIPRIASVDEFEDLNDIYYYEYSKKEEHLSILEKTLLRARSDWDEKKDYFNLRAQRLQKEVSKYTTDFLAQQMINAKLFNLNNE